MLAEVQRYVTFKPGFPIELRTREEWCLQGWVKFRKVLKFALVAWMERSGIRGMRAGVPHMSRVSLDSAALPPGYITMQ